MNNIPLPARQTSRTSAAHGILIAIILISLGLRARAGEVIPPVPKHYFNDYAQLASPAVAKQLDARLVQFEKDTTGQIVVAIFPKMESDASVEDYGKRIANAWKVGQKDKNNGLVLVIFMQDHKMSLQTGLGYEKIVTDEICQKILDNELTPLFSNGNYDEGLVATVNAMIAATQGKYKSAEKEVPAKK